MNDETARRLKQDFSGWQCWYGAATRAWWTLPPPDCWYPSLIEAATPEELAARISAVATAGRWTAAAAA
ncbi:MAG TPA: hypothetical protein VH912_24360 [Streptosporangiaceae bacterium]|jgi:hypothetical protein